ncbi:MAG: hypothetical protein V4629_05205 [Pseudomonadota bacterium]
MKNLFEFRAVEFAEKVHTSIWYESAFKHNPYLTDQLYCHGEAIIDLMSSHSFDEYLFFLLTSKFPTQNQKKIFNALLIGISNVGLRHPANRAVIIAAASKTYSQNLLPIGLSILGGSYLGADEVLSSMKWISKNKHRNPKDLIFENQSSLIQANDLEKSQEHVFPGFGRQFDGVAPWPKRLSKKLISIGEEIPHLLFCEQLVFFLEEQDNSGWLITGLAAATLLDLGFHWKSGAILFQLLATPGLAASSLEMSEKDYTSLPFIAEENYILTTSK